MQPKFKEKLLKIEAMTNWSPLFIYFFQNWKDSYIESDPKKTAQIFCTAESIQTKKTQI